MYAAPLNCWYHREINSSIQIIHPPLSTTSNLIFFPIQFFLSNFLILCSLLPCGWIHLADIFFLRLNKIYWKYLFRRALIVSVFEIKGGMKVMVEGRGRSRLGMGFEKGLVKRGWIKGDRLVGREGAHWMEMSQLSCHAFWSKWCFWLVRCWEDVSCL